MTRAFLAATAYFLAVFAIGFVLGTIRVLIVAPRLGLLASTCIEVPVILTAAYFVCRRAIGHWQVLPTAAVRWTMVVWFLMLLFIVETLLGALLFDRSLDTQWQALVTPAGLVGFGAQLIAAVLPVFNSRSERE